jgi:hypothetical protein
MACRHWLYFSWHERVEGSQRKGNDCCDRQLLMSVEMMDDSPRGISAADLPPSAVPRQRGDTNSAPHPLRAANGAPIMRWKASLSASKSWTSTCAFLAWHRCAPARMGSHNLARRRTDILYRQDAFRELSEGCIVDCARPHFGEGPICQVEVRSVRSTRMKIGTPRAYCLDEVEQHHEAEIHVQLSMTVEQGRTGIAFVLDVIDIAADAGLVNERTTPNRNLEGFGELEVSVLFAGDHRE